MPRGGRSRGRSFSPVRSAPKTVSRPPVQQQQRAPVPAQPQGTAVGPTAQRGPGLMGQMAATAGGVAIGSALGHVIGGAMTNSGQQEQSSDVTYQEQPANQQQQPYQQPEQGAACRFELQQFLNCAQSQHDITLCEGFNEALKQCKQSYGMH